MHLLNLLDGLPVAKVVTGVADDSSQMTNEELEAQIEGFARKTWLSRTLGMTAEELEAEIDQEVGRIRRFARQSCSTRVAS
jgi:hypothetical protein